MRTTGRGEQKKEKIDNITARVRDLNVCQIHTRHVSRALQCIFGLLRLDMSRKKINSRGFSINMKRKQ